MTAILVILCIVLFFALIFSLRIKLFIRLTDSLIVRAGLGPVIFTLVPQKKKKIKISDFTYKKHQKRIALDKKKTLKKISKQAARDAKKKKNHALAEKIDEAQAAEESGSPSKLTAVIEIIKFVFEEFPKLASYIKTEINMLDITVGGKDAAATAKNYGIICTLTSCLIELLDNKTSLKQIKQETVSVKADFLAEKTVIRLDIGLKLSLFSIVKVGFHTLKWLITQKIKRN